MLRAYGPINTRQQGADRLVMNEDDLRRVLWQAVDPNFTGKRPSTIRLGADIILTRPIELKAAQYNVTIDGGRQFDILQSRTYNYEGLFVLEDGQTSDIEFVGVTFRMPNAVLGSTARNIFDCSLSSTVNDISLLDCAVEENIVSVRLFSASITAVDIKVILDEITAFSINPGSVGNFSGILQNTTSFQVWYYESRPVMTVLGLLGNSGVGFGTTGPLLSVDIDGGMRLRSASVTLSNNDPTLTVGDRTTFSITCDATSTGTIQIPAGYTGQLLVLYFAAVDAGSTVKLDDTATVDVNKNHIAKKPIVDETVTFMYLNGKWRELCRSENA